MTAPELPPSTPPPIRVPRRIGFGRILDRLGLLGLPLSIGLVAGFWAADLGARWLPTMLGIVLLLCAASLLALGAGAWMGGSTVAVTGQERSVRRRVIVLLTLALLGLGGRLAIFWLERPSPLTALSPADFERAFADDLARYRDYDAHLEGLLAELERQGSLRAAGDRVLSAVEERSLLDAFAALHDLAFGLDQVRLFWEDYYRFDPSRAGRDRHLRSYLLTYAAELALYEKSVRFTHLVIENPSAAKFLNAPHPAENLPADSFSRFRQELQGTSDQARVLAGEQYLRWLDEGLGGRRESEALGLGWLWEAIRRHLDTIASVAPLDRALLTVRSDAQPWKRTLKRAWFPAQQGVAEWMGDTRTRRIGWYLITPEQLRELDLALEPGDILLSRKNWYLSNLGLPGFWPHAILYLGEPRKLASAFDRPEVKGFLAQLAGRDVDLAEFLAARYPDRYLRYTVGEGETPYRVIEAISEGVVLNTLEHAAGDYLAALRPRLPPLAKAQAILTAFEQLGKPYDFDFDFATDHALVCTELVWRSYRPAPGKEGLDLPLVAVMGRQTLPANEFASLFARERGADARRFDYVSFLDANERERRAFAASEEAFAASAQRAKWDLAQR